VSRRTFQCRTDLRRYVEMFSVSSRSSWCERRGLILFDVFLVLDS